MESISRVPDDHGHPRLFQEISPKQLDRFRFLPQHLEKDTDFDSNEPNVTETECNKEKLREIDVKDNDEKTVTSPAYDFPSTVCSEPLESSSPQCA